MLSNRSRCHNVNWNRSRVSRRRRRIDDAVHYVRERELREKREK
jgi:hypothetical protein